MARCKIALKNSPAGLNLKLRNSEQFSEFFAVETKHNFAVDICYWHATWPAHFFDEFFVGFWILIDFLFDEVDFVVREPFFFG